MQPDQFQNNPNQVNLTDCSGMYTPPTLAQEPIQQPNVNNEVIIENAPIRWSAYEYIYREKNGLWFICFLFVIVIFILIDYFFLKSYMFSILVIVMAVSLVILNRRPPRLISYALSDSHGLYIGEKLYHFNEFKAFGIIQDDGYNSILLIPIKRFSPGVSVYFPHEVGEEVVDIFGARLPMEKVKLDFVDIIIKKLRI